MAEVPFAIDAKGGEKSKQGRYRKHDLRGRFVDKESSFEGGALELSSMTKGEIVDQIVIDVNRSVLVCLGAP